MSRQQNNIPHPLGELHGIDRPVGVPAGRFVPGATSMLLPVHIERAMCSPVGVAP